MDRRRRRLFKSIGLFGAVGIAGCSSDGSEQPETRKGPEAPSTRADSAETPTLLPSLTLSETRPPAPSRPPETTPVPSAPPPAEQAGRITTSDGENGDGFGYAVAVSGDGQTVVVGIPGDEVPHESPGTASVFTKSDGAWREVNRLVPDGDAVLFGRSVAMSRDGTTAVVGAANSFGPGGTVGLAYVFDGSDGVWTQQVKLNAADGDAGDYFGSAVAMSADGTNALVGAIGDADPNGEYAGSAYVFEETDGSWNQTAKLLPSDGDGDDYFGSAVAMSADGTNALVGAKRDEDPNGEHDDYGDGGGSGYVFTRSSGSWEEVAKIVAEDGNQRDSFGHSLAMSDDGTTALVGTKGADAAYVFETVGGNWRQTAHLYDEGNTRGGLGVAVALSGDGSTALVDATGSEAVYVFSESGTSWNEVGRLVAADGVSRSYGRSLSVSADGGTALVGDPSATNSDDDSTGVAYLFE